VPLIVPADCLALHRPLPKRGFTCAAASLSCAQAGVGCARVYRLTHGHVLPVMKLISCSVDVALSLVSYRSKRWSVSISKWRCSAAYRSHLYICAADLFGAPCYFRVLRNREGRPSRRCDCCSSRRRLWL